MKKGTRIVKRLLVQFLVVLMSINSFGAVVSDNDGSAFITKAEFDSLKNNFQAQIDQYNTSIDSKIDGAIASYLAGVKMEKETILNVPLNNYDQINWLSSFQIKGNRKKWSSWSDYTETTNQWFEWPAEKRRGLRNGDLRLSFGSGHFGCWNGRLLWKLSAAVDGLTIGLQGTYAEEAFHGPTYLQCVDTDQYVRLKNDTGLVFESASDYGVSTGYQYDRDTYVVDGDTKAEWEMSYGDFYVKNTDPGVLVELSHRPDEHFVLEINGYYLRSGTEKPTTWTHHFMTNYSTIGQVQEAKTLKNNDKYAGLTRASAESDRITSGTLAAGVSAYYIEGSAYDAILGSLKKCMLGSNTTQSTNIVRNNITTKQMHYYKLIDEFSDYVTMPGNITTFGVAGIPTEVMYTGTDRRLTGITFPLSIEFPLLENVKLRDIETNQYIVSKEHLKIGAGMPLILESVNKGNLEITFKARLQRLVDTSSSSSIRFDVANHDFTDVSQNTTGFYTGSINDGASVVLNNSSLTSSTTLTQKVLIENVKQGDSVWIRFRPETTDGGYYATISDLKLKFIEE